MADQVLSKQQGSSPLAGLRLIVVLSIVWLAAFGAGVVCLDAWRKHWWVLLLISGMTAVLAAMFSLVRSGWTVLVSRRATDVEPAKRQVSMAQIRSSQTAIPLVDKVDAHKRPIVVNGSVFTLAKHGSQPHDNEDAGAISLEHARAAVCDGASSSFDSGRWARHLCEGFIAAGPELSGHRLWEWIIKEAADFRSATNPERPDAESWWSSASQGRDSHATLLAFVLFAGTGGLEWQAAAIGDSCLVQVRTMSNESRLVDAFPVERSGGFGGDPWLVSSGVSDLKAVPPVRFSTGSAAYGDTFLLMSDEMSRWSLARHEAAMPVWDTLVSDDHDALIELIQQDRASGVMVNDDLTCVRVTVEMSH